MKKYLENFKSPFPQNERYLSELSEMIDWNCGKPLGSETLFRFRAIGKFLKLNELPKILSWEAIEAALPPLTGKRRTEKQIRSSLMDLGHLYAARGELPDWNSYLSHRRINRKTELLPARYCENVRSFKVWLENGMLNPNLILRPASVQILSNSSQTIGDIIRTIVHFLSWCGAGGIGDISAVDENVIIDYQWELLWEYECRMCKKRIPFEIDVPEHCVDPECGASQCYRLKQRVSRGYVMSETGHLRVFFDWAVLHGLHPENSARQELWRSAFLPFEHDALANDRRIGIAIRRYSDDVIRALCVYMFSDHADPEEALILYLIIFHLCTVQELCGLRVPSTVESAATFEADYERLLFSAHKLTRGNRRPRRTGKYIKFPRRASARLRPLLERYYDHRKQLINAPRHEYLLVAINRCRHNRPVSQNYVRNIVRRASLRVLKDGEVCASRLRITAAALFSKNSKKRSGVLGLLGYRSAHATAFNYLEQVIVPLKTTRRSHDRQT